MLVYRGEVPEDLPLDLPTLAGSFGFPIKYGYATVGRILDVGPGVEDLAAGDFVFVHHPHQDVFVVPGAMAVRLPDGLDPLLGPFVANLETAINVVHDTPLRLGETALVFGQGVVGLLAAQLLKIVGAGRVLAVDPLKKRREPSQFNSPSRAMKAVTTTAAPKETICRGVKTRSKEVPRRGPRKTRIGVTRKATWMEGPKEIAIEKSMLFL
jgi:D-arabinose 1-dehydrogenase-like Zn-dependent alcohol dehydrogenase